MYSITLVLCSLLSCWNHVLGEILVTFPVQEETSGRLTVGNIAQAANLSQSVTGVDPASLTFEIQNYDNEYSQYFSIESADLYLDQKLDRDTITQCDGQLECFIEIQISVTGGTYLEIVKVFVKVLDINDNAPTFPVLSVELTIAEGQPDGTPHELPSATDRDSGDNANISYHLEPTGSSFRLEIQHNLDGSQTLRLLQDLPIDREEWDRYVLFVVAEDNGFPPRNASLKVIVNVGDINDNRPVFRQLQYNVTIREDEESGTTFLTVTATDRDIGENGKISYSFTKAEPTNSILSSVGINESTGAISVIGNFPSDVAGPFVLFLEARDHGNNVKRGYAKVIVNVLDINNHAPVIVIGVVKNGEIEENDSVGTPVATVRVLDADRGINGESECDCNNINFTLHELSTNSYKVASAIMFDRETMDTYNVTVNCKDKGTPSLNASVSFIVKVTDENDNMPIFTQNQYFGNITENKPNGYIILRVSATDKDEGLNAEIQYEIVSFLGDEKFRIDSSTGLISVGGNFDRETRDLYKFQVNARDKGLKGYLQSTANVTVYVLDDNDHAPKFKGDSYSMSVPENMNKSSSVGEVEAEDVDLGDNGRISYMIPSEYSHLPFAILDDGTVITTKVLDRENISSYNLAVAASDHGNPPKETRIPVTVLVLDQNDNAPVIRFPNDSSNNSVALPHSTITDTVITTIEAYDIDEKDNQRLLYYIVAGNNAGIFQINEHTGDIILRKQISDGDIKLYTLTILVKDQGEKIQHESRQTLIVRFFVSGISTDGPVSVTKGRNIMIAIIISCVTLVLSIIIIVVILFIRRKDNQKSLYNAKSYDQQKIMDSGHRNSNRSNSSRGSRDKMIYPDNGYQVDMRKKKEVSFSLEEEQDGNVSKVPTSDKYDAVSTFRSTPSPVPKQELPLESMQYRQVTPPPKPERIEDTKQRDIHRMTSLRVHQALIQSQQNNNNNNNNSNKQWQHTTQEEPGRTFIGLSKPHLDDSHSESSGEVTTSDSGRGGSEEDIRSSMTTSQDTDEARSPNTSSSHPFYTSESNQPTFSSFHGNSVHKTGPILSSFLNKPTKQRHHGGDYVDSFPLNDLSNPNRNTHRHSTEVNGVPIQRNSATNFPLNFGPKPSLMDSDPLLRTSKHSNLNYGNSFEDESVAGRSQIDDDDNTTTSGSYTVNDVDNDILNSDINEMFYKPDTFV